MSKEYYQGKKDKMDEKRGMKDSYRNEMEDYGMIKEDRNAVANLPQEVIMRAYPKGNYGYEKGLNDTIGGIDMQIRDDSKKFKKDAYPEKY